jgi:DNA polymerase
MTGRDATPGELARLIGDARRLLELERAYGQQAAPFDPERVRARTRAVRSAAAIRTREAMPSAEDKQKALDALREALAPCCKCGLGATRQNLVFGEGNPDAALMFIGEAPGRKEDEQGRPFVGPAGQLLTNIIEAMGLTRDQVYIANVLKCRPPNNRTPSAGESERCFPYLLKQIDVIAPRIIVTLGNPATKTVLQTQKGITKMRGQFVAWNAIEVMPTFHPSFLLRSPNRKREVWEDMQKVHRRMKELGLPIGELKTRRRSG